MTFRLRVTWIACLLLALLPVTLCAEISITLQREFIEFYKGRATIDTSFVVDKAHKNPNPPSKDGDLHIAGRADEVKLPIVAEIMNARDDRPAVDTIHDVEGTGQAIAMSGAWRLWCEHGGNSEQIQGEPLQPFHTTNPDHVFEIHPVTFIDGRSVLPTLKPIQGFRTKDAHDAFTTYENVRCTIIPGSDTTTLVTTMAGYNYVEFIMEINSESRESDDGRMVFAKVRDLAGELLVRNRRMVMVKDSEVEQQTRSKPIGTRVHVLGLPRINLSLVSWRVQAAQDGREEVLRWNLPYEIIVVGFYDFAPSDEEPAPVPRARMASTPRYVPRTLSTAELNRLWRMPSNPESDPHEDSSAGKFRRDEPRRSPLERPLRPLRMEGRNRGEPEMIEER